MTYTILYYGTIIPQVQGTSGHAGFLVFTMVLGNLSPIHFAPKFDPYPRSA